MRSRARLRVDAGSASADPSARRAGRPPAHLGVACAQMRDLLHRPLRDLRVSVTDRCNLRCRYCMPREVYGAGFAYLARAELLSFEEIDRLVRVLAGLGVERVRLTGGEPLLRRGVERLVEMLVRIEGIRDVSLTTNGVLLAHRARALKQSGLVRVTVSLDALDASVMRAMTDA